MLALVIPAVLSLAACSAEPEEPRTCCSLEDVTEMCTARLSDDLIVSTIEAGTETLELSAQDVIGLNEAGCSDAVINTLRGSSVAEVEEVEDAAEVEEVEKADAPPWVDLSVSDGAMFMDLRNNTGRTLTNLKITVNGSYTYLLPKLGAGDTDSTPKGKFRNSDGDKWGSSIRKIYVRCDQGVFSKSF